MLKLESNKITLYYQVKQQFTFQEMTIKYRTTDQCLEYLMIADQYTAILNECDGSRSQQWIMKSNSH